MRIPSARNDGPDAQIMKKMLAAATVPCPVCSGFFVGDMCKTCNGKGKVVQTLGGLIPAPEGT